MFKKKMFWIVLLVLALLGGGGYAAYAYWFAPEEFEEETVLETASVTTGDLAITADGTGLLVASSEVDLAFGSSQAYLLLMFMLVFGGAYLYMTRRAMGQRG